MTPPDPDPDFLTTREVAALLRVKERKVYDLAAAGEIPHRRVTGKLLFPRREVDLWLEAAGVVDARGARAPLLVGSHDPLLDWSLRESGSTLATLTDGSSDGLRRFVAGDASLCALHLIETDGWNLAAVKAAAPRDAVLLGWVRRMQGLLRRAGTPAATGMTDLAGRRLAVRQTGAGTRLLFEHLAQGAGLESEALLGDAIVCRTEHDVAAAVAAGDADIALGPEAGAAAFGLVFEPLIDEQVDLLVDRRAYFSEPLQRLFRFAQGAAFADKAARFGGYDIASLGEVRWLGP